MSLETRPYSYARRRADWSEVFLNGAVGGICLLMPLYHPLLGPLPALAWLGLFALLGLSRPKQLSGALLQSGILLVLPLMATASYFWSTEPGISARYGIQFLLTCFIGIYFARLLTPTRMVSIFFASMLVFCVLSIASGRQGPSETGLVLVGLTGSKNAMASMGYLLLASSLGVLLNRDTPRLLRRVSPLGILIALFIITTTASATAFVLSVGGAGLFVLLVYAQRLPPGGRVMTIVVTLLLLTPFLMILPEIGQSVTWFMQDVLHKDMTLTGRTQLWALADDLISRRPILGYGYQSIWLGDSFETQTLLQITGMASGRGFNFHHTYRQFAVDIGLLGMGVLILTILAPLIAGLVQFVRRPHPSTSFFLALALVMLAQSFTEVVLGSFGLPTVLLFAAFSFMLQRPQREAPTPPVARGLFPRSAMLPQGVSHAGAPLALNRPRSAPDQ